MSRRSGVPLERRAGRRYDPAAELAQDDRTVPLSRAPVSRRLATAVNRTRARAVDTGARPVLAGELHALGLLHDVFHHLIERYEAEARPGALDAALDAVTKARGKRPTTKVLTSFDREFPGATPAAAHDGRSATLEELLLNWLVNVNPAAEPMRELFDDRPIGRSTDYASALEALEAFFASQPAFGPEGETLIELLRAPALASPTSLAGQLRYIRDRWASMLGSMLDRLLVAIDVIAEEERALHLRFGGGADGGFGGVVDVPSFGGLDDEPERFSRDSDWMPRLVLIAKSTYVWLDQLSRRHERDIRTLDAIPDEELDRLARSGITGLWLIGLWERSKASERIKRMRGNPDAVASAYSLDDYRIADDLGGEGGFNDLKARAWSRGIRIASDMVPNHMGLDSQWVVEHPDWFLALPEPPYPGYTFNGQDLSSDDRVGIFLEDHYWDNSDAAVVFKRLDRWSGDARYVYHGNDGTSFPWNDTAQLDYLKAEVREAVIRTILDVARRSPVIRFDAAMVLAKKHIQRLWYPEPGHGGAIPSRAEFGSMARAAFDALMPVEFWREVVDRVAAEVPDTLLLAEAFWMLEGYFVRTLGMHRVYNSAFMHMLRDEDNAGYRRLMKETLEFDTEILQRYVNFMNNPDEKTAVEQFGKGDKYFGVAMLMATLPGLPMIGHGQIEGFGEKYGMEFRRATLDEQPDPWLVERHERELFPILHRRGWFAGAEDFTLYDFVTDGGGVDENVFAYSNGRGPSRSLVVYHNRFATTSGRIGRSVAFARKRDDGTRKLEHRSLIDGLGLGGHAADELVAFRDARGGLEYLRRIRELRDGLRIELDAYRGHVFWEFRLVSDTAGVWHRLADRLGGRGVPSLEDALREQELEPVFGALRDALAPTPPAGAIEELVRSIADATGTGGPADRRAVADRITTRLGAIEALAAARVAKADPLHPVRAAFTDPWHRAVLDAWAVLEPVGGLAAGGRVPATSRAWVDELRLAPVAADALRRRDLDEAAAWSAVERVRVLIAAPRPATVGGRRDADRAARLARAWLETAETRAFLRVNRWQGEEWFDRDAWRELVDWSLVLDAVELAADESTTAEARKRATGSTAKLMVALAKAAEDAGYNADKLRAALDPAPRAAARKRLDSAQAPPAPDLQTGRPRRPAKRR